MKPEPSELVLRGCKSLLPPLEPPPGPLRFLKKSSKNSSNGEPGGKFGIAPRSPPPPLASTVCEVEILTTASITFSAMSAMPSGPRAEAGADAKTLAAPIEIAAPIRRRRRLKAGLAPVMSASLQRIDLRSTVRPNGSVAQAFEPDISAKNRPTQAHDFVDLLATYTRHSGMGRRTRPQVRNCTRGNLEIPGSRFACPGMTVENQRRTSQIRINPATADPIPTMRRILSGVASALFMARRIQAGLAANIRPSSTNRIPTPMRKSANAMDLIGWQPPVISSFFFYGSEADSASLEIMDPARRAYCFGAAATGGWPDGLAKKRKNSESGRSRKRVSLLFRPFSYADIER